MRSGELAGRPGPRPTEVPPEGPVFVLVLAVLVGSLVLRADVVLAGLALGAATAVFLTVRWMTGATWLGLVAATTGLALAGSIDVAAASLVAVLAVAVQARTRHPLAMAVAGLALLVPGAPGALVVAFGGAALLALGAPFSGSRVPAWAPWIVTGWLAGASIWLHGFVLVPLVVPLVGLLVRFLFAHPVRFAFAEWLGHHAPWAALAPSGVALALAAVGRFPGLGSDLAVLLAAWGGLAVGALLVGILLGVDVLLLSGDATRAPLVSSLGALGLGVPLLVLEATPDGALRGVAAMWPVLAWPGAIGLLRLAGAAGRYRWLVVAIGGAAVVVASTMARHLHA